MASQMDIIELGIMMYNYTHFVILAPPCHLLILGKDISIMYICRLIVRYFCRFYFNGKNFRKDMFLVPANLYLVNANQKLG